MIVTRVHVIVSVLLGLLLEPPSVVGQQASPTASSFPRARPADVGMSEQGLNEIAAYLREQVASRRLSGAVALVLRGGHEVYRVGVGFADAEAQRPMMSRTVFRIASMTKPITSVAILQLEDRGLLSVQDPVSKHLAEFSRMRVLRPPPVDPAKDVQTTDADREITIHDLLTHTSGITYGFWGEEPLSSLYREAQVTDGLIEVPWTLEENVRRLAKMPLTAQPGSRWQYGLSTDVLGRVIEVVSGQPLDVYLRDNVLAPLGMDDTHFVLPAEKLGRLATLYQPDEEGRIQRTPDGEVESGPVRYSSTLPLEQDKSYLSGGAGLVSTADDYARFCQMLLNGGSLDGAEILRPDTAGRMTKNQIGGLSNDFTIHGDKFGYGVGVLTDEAGIEDCAAPGTYSWGGIFNTVFWVDPREELVGILMTQLFPFDHLTVREDFKRLMYEAISGPVPGVEEAPTGEPVQSLGPQPGEVYREFALHNGGNVNWRVTDPNATAERARMFLPNPILTLNVGDLEGAVRAEALLDRWGGHLRTTAKQVRFNQNAWITVPEIATTPAGHAAEKYYSQDNPVIPVPLDHLHEGENTVEGTCSTIEDYGWGQWGLYSLVLRVYYQSGVQSIPAGRIVSPQTGAALAESPTIRIDTDGDLAVDRVDVIAWYDGLDEDGDGRFLDWHEAVFQPQRGKPATLAGHVGTDIEPPFEITWDTTWVPDQRPHTMKLMARIRSVEGVWAVTPVVEGLSLVRNDASVRIFRAEELPERFGVRVDRTASCTIPIPESVELQRAESAVLHLRTWHGFAEVHSSARLNDHPLMLEGKNHHYDADLLSVAVSALRSGDNIFAIHSATEEHMLEVLWPGPELAVRFRGD